MASSISYIGLINSTKYAHTNPTFEQVGTPSENAVKNKLRNLTIGYAFVKKP